MTILLNHDELKNKRFEPKIAEKFPSHHPPPAALHGEAAEQACVREELRYLSARQENN